MMERRHVLRVNKKLIKRKNRLKILMSVLTGMAMMTMLPLQTMAGNTAPANKSTVVDTVNVTDKNTKIYAGEVKLNGSSQLKYLYSDDITVTQSVFDNLRDELKDTDFEGMVPSIVNDTTAVNGFFYYEGNAQEGTIYKEETNYFGGISEDWKSAADVAGRCFAGNVGEETNKNGSDFDSILSTSVSSSWVTKDGALVKQDKITFHNENTAIIYTSVDVTSSKAVVKTVPKARTLTCNGQAQELVTAGEAEGGTMQYALGTASAATGAYSATIPKATNAGT